MQIQICFVNKDWLVNVKMLPLYLVIDVSSGAEGAFIYEVNNALKKINSFLTSDTRCTEKVSISLILHCEKAFQFIPLTSVWSLSLPILKAGPGRENMKDALSLLEQSIGKDVHPSNDCPPTVFLFTRDKFLVNVWENQTKNLKNIRRSFGYFFYFNEKVNSNNSDNSLKNYCSLHDANYLAVMINAVLFNFDNHQFETGSLEKVKSIIPPPKVSQNKLFSPIPTTSTLNTGISKTLSSASDVNVGIPKLDGQYLFVFDDNKEKWNIRLKESTLKYGVFGKYWIGTSSTSPNPSPFYLLPDLESVVVSSELLIQKSIFESVHLVQFEQKDGIIEQQEGGYKNEYSASIWVPEGLPLDARPLNGLPLDKNPIKKDTSSLPSTRTFAEAILSLCKLLEMYNADKSINVLCLNFEYIWLSKKGLHLINCGVFEVNNSNHINPPQIDDIKNIISKYLVLWANEHNISEFLAGDLSHKFWSRWDSKKGIDGILDFVNNGHLFLDEKLIRWQIWLKQFVDRYNNEVLKSRDYIPDIKSYQEHAMVDHEEEIKNCNKVIKEEPFNNPYDENKEIVTLNLIADEFLRLRRAWVDARKKLCESLSFWDLSRRQQDRGMVALRQKNDEIFTANQKINALNLQVSNLNDENRLGKKENQSLETKIKVLENTIVMSLKKNDELNQNISVLIAKKDEIFKKHTHAESNLANALKKEKIVTDKNKKLLSSCDELIASLEQLCAGLGKRILAISMDILFFSVFLIGSYYFCFKSFPDLQKTGFSLGSNFYLWPQIFWVAFLAFSFRSIFSPAGYLIGIYPILVKKNRPIELLDFQHRFVSGLIHYGVWVFLFYYASEQYRPTEVNFIDFKQFFSNLNISHWIYVAYCLYLFILFIITVIQSFETDAWFSGSTLIENLLLNIGFCSVDPRVIEEFQNNIQKIK